MLITTRPLNCFGKMVPAGQPIPNPEKWNKVALQSNINIGFIREATEAEIELLGGTKTEAPAPPKPAGDESLRCPECPDRAFKSQRALTVHGRSHRKK